VRLGAVPAGLLVLGVAVATLLADRLATVAVATAVLLVVCSFGPRRRARLYAFGAISTGLGVVVLSPFLQQTGFHVLWTGPHVPVLGTIDVTSEELQLATLNGLRLTALGLAFSAYALLLDHDALLSAFGFARRSSLAAALATRLVPTLERDAAGLAEAMRGRGVALSGARGHARLLSPLVAGSLERASSLAEAMEARGYGRAGATRAPQPAWTTGDRGAAALALVLAVAGALWL
jgi:energy-coupling factor transport system permease protein